MSESKTFVGLVGLYDDPDGLIRAARQVRDAGYQKWDCHTPYPVHGLDQAMGLKPSPLPYICLGSGFVGAALALGMRAVTASPMLEKAAAPTTSATTTAGIVLAGTSTS